MVKNYNEILYENETLPTPRLTLRKFRKTDAADVFEYGSDAETLKYLVWEGLKTEDEAKESIINYYWSRLGFFAIELNETGKCIGGIDIRVDPDNEKASFGYVLNRAFWGKGYMTEALNAVLDLCLDKLQLNRVESTHYVGNEASGRVMQKCGMVYEGTGIREVKVKGVFYDVVHYAIVK